MVNLSGRVIKGYELRKSIGQGGFGAVYQAFQPAVGRDVAIKIILPQYANHPDFIRRFEAEAQTVARLEHPHIVPLYDYWREPDGAYLIMRFLKGGSLSDAIFSDGPFTAARASRVVDQIAGALTVAHRHSVIHRDLKPANILLDEDENAYLADFGIAKITGDGEEDEEVIAGSPAYISPEQIISDPVTPQSDIYSFGVVLYEMLTGHQPFEQMTAPELILKHLNEPLPNVEMENLELPAGIDAVVQRATAKTPADRYPDALAMAEDLRKYLAEGTETILLDIVNVELVNPYKGLRAFEEADASDFYGREQLVEQLIHRLKESTPQAHFLAVVGPSGSGKSSVVKAGVVPALRHGALPGSENWFIAEMAPGPRPLDELANALLSVAVMPAQNLADQIKGDEIGLLNAVNRILPAGDNVLLIIDQFEEVFAQVTHEDERAHFLNSLRIAATTPGSRLWVIVTLRADFYDKPLMYEGFASLMRQRTEVVVPLTTEELERAIVSPAERVGLEVEPELLATIVGDVSQEPGTLPLLQYALTEVFERREGRILTLSAYQASGGALGALARRAEELFEQMDRDRRSLIRQIFLRLVNLGEGTEDTRRRVGWAELVSFAGDGPDLQAVLDTYGKYRLLSFDRDPATREPTVEIAHEALIREWGRLREWLSSSREDVRLQRRLAAGATEWRASNREASFLMRGAQLEQLEDWAAVTDLAFTEEERGYLAASIVERRTQESREESRRRRQVEQERRARVRLQVLVAILAVAAGVALGLTVFSFNQSQQSENRAATATIEQGLALEMVATSQTQVALQSDAVATANMQHLEALQQVSQEGAQSSALRGELATAVVQREGALSQVATAEGRSDELQSLYLASSAAAVFAAGDQELALALAVEAASVPNPPAPVRETLLTVSGLNAADVTALSTGELADRVRQDMNVRDLTCAERETYRATPYCSVQNAPTPTP